MPAVYLHGAIKNAGDYLIWERGVAAIQEARPDYDLESVPRWSKEQPTPGRVSTIILGGGPALRRSLRSVYPGFVDCVLDRELAPVGLALGWAGDASAPPSGGYFDAESVEVLQRAAEYAGSVSVRDVLSADVVSSAGVAPTMTGCVAWYDVPLIETRMFVPSKVERLVFTTPAKAENWRQAVSVMRELRNVFPSAERICSFHRGIGPGEHTGRREAARNYAMAAAARSLGYAVVNAAYGTRALESYRTADLHVGYRVHAHLYCLAGRRPSLLIEEDGRGAGQALTLHPEMRFPAATLSPRDLGRAVSAEVSAGMPASVGAANRMRATWPVMRDFLRALPAV